MSLEKLSWGTTRVWVRRPCLRHRGRSSTGRFTRRALTPAMAARRRVTPDTTPMKPATKRWATLRAAVAPDRNPLGWTTLNPTPTLSWSSPSKWKMKRCWAIPSVTPPLMLPSSAAPWRALIGPRIRPKQLTPDGTQPGSSFQQLNLNHAYLTSLRGLGKPAAAMMEMCSCLRSTSGLWMNVCYNILFPLLFFFFFNSTCLCLALSVLNQSSPTMNV